MKRIVSFHCIGIDKHGKRCNCIIQARNKQEIVKILKDRKIIAIKIRRKFQLNTKKEKTTKINKQALTSIIRELATLINTGIPILKSLSIMRKTTENSATKNLINTIEADLKNGLMLSDACKKHPRYFDQLFCNLVNIGEQSGTLDQILIHLANHREKIDNLKRKITKALFYPIAIMSIAIIVTAVLLIFVVPQFTEIFANFGAALPTYTQIIIRISSWLKHYGGYLLAIIIITIPAIKFAKNRFRLFAKLLDSLSIKLPIFGKILRKSIISRITRCLAIAYAAGLPLTKSLKIVSTVANNLVYEKVVMNISASITNGDTLAIAMSREPLMPNRATQMISVGEQSGSLGNMLNKIAEYYEAEVDNLVDNLNNLLEPTIMVMLGLVIGGLITGMYLPIFKLGTVI